MCKECCNRILREKRAKNPNRRRITKLVNGMKECANLECPNGPGPQPQSNFSFIMKRGEKRITSRCTSCINEQSRSFQMMNKDRPEVKNKKSEYSKEYSSREHVKERRRDAQRERRKDPELVKDERERGRIYDKKRNGTTKRVASNKRYRESDGYLGVTRARQRIYRKSESGKAVRKRYESNNPRKTFAHRVLILAVYYGIIDKPFICSSCEAEFDFKSDIKGHHHNGYEWDHILDVVWLCDKCHKKEHREETVDV